MNFGLGVEDVEYIVTKMATEKFSSYSQEAFQVMKERVEEFAENYIREMLDRDPAAIENIKDPGMQSALLDAESGFAKTGDTDLGSILVDILVERTLATKRDVLQLALNEAIGVTQKLAANHLSAISIVFLFRQVRHVVNSVSELHDRWRVNLPPLVSDFACTDSDARYLMGTGCAVLTAGATSIADSLRTEYPGLFCKGLTLEENPALEKFMDSPFVMPCIRDSQRLQISTTDETTLREAAKQANIGKEDVDTLANLLQSNPMNDEEINSELIEIVPGMEKVIEAWGGSTLRQIIPTATGIAIGHANVRRVTENQFQGDLRIWIK
ncbi:LPO_1073/Vpar_1526 family protein [Streptomyces sp. NPDC005125]